MSCKYDQDCSDHGVCKQTCTCYDSYIGEFCELCASDQYIRTDGFCLLKCSSSCPKGYQCKYHPEINQNVCDCNILNANPDEECSYCKSGFAVVDGNTCIPRSCVTKGQICGGQGECIEDAGSYSCKCKAGFIGTFCENCDTFLSKTSDGKCLPEECIDNSQKECADKGKCDVPEKECVCDHSYAGRQCTECSIGFREYDDYYSIVCLSEVCYNEDDTEPCSTNGECFQAGMVAYCNCYESSTGETCQTCKKDYTPLSSGYCMPEACAFNGADCAGYGYCVRKSGGFGCVCNENFDDKKQCSSCFDGYTFITGQCISEDCEYNNKECNSHGYCLTADEIKKIYKCVCEYGYSGQFCNECDTDGGYITVDGGMCVQPECVINNTACSNNGECYDGGYYDGWYCECNFGAFGDFCENCRQDYLIGDNGACILEDCYSEGKECSGNGYCSSLNSEHKCICNSDDLTEESRCSQCVPGLTLKNGICGGSSNKLSGGAIAGIIIAVLIILVAVCLGIYFGMKNKNKTKIVPQDAQATKAENGNYN